MNKAVTPKQLELTAGKTREELILMTAPHIDPESPALKADRAKMDEFEKEEAARAVLGENAPDKPFATWDGDPDRFDWATDDAVILREQRATAAYYNKEGELIIRQRCWPDDDGFVFIAPECVTEFLEGVAKRARE